MEFGKDFQVPDKAFGFFKIGNPILFPLQGFHNLLGIHGIIPKAGGKRFFFFILDFDAFGIYVKDTSLTHRGVPKAFSACRSYKSVLMAQK